MSASGSPAADAVNQFLSTLQDQTVKNVNCHLSIASQQVGNIHEVDIKNCSINLKCCNSTNATEIMACDPSSVLNAGVSAITAQTSKSPDNLAYLIRQLGALYDKSQPITNSVSTYLNQTCKAFDSTEQTIDISLTAIDCKNAAIDLYNFSDVNIRCGAAAISSLLPNPVTSQTASFFQLHRTAVKVLIGLGILLIIFIAIIIGVNHSRKNITVVRQPQVAA